MPHRIQASDLPMEDRRPQLVKYRSQLRKLLREPGLTQRIREKYAERLARVESDLAV